MAGQTWSITIVPNSGFQVDAYGQSGSDLQAQNGDMVSWNNQTADEHQPVVASSGGGDPTPLCDVIAPWEQSTPGYICGSTSVDYYCKFHESETGSITIVS